MAWRLSRTQGQSPGRMSQLTIHILARLPVEPGGCLLAELALDELHRTDSRARSQAKAALQAISHCFRLVEVPSPDTTDTWGSRVAYAVAADNWEDVKKFLSGKKLD